MMHAVKHRDLRKIEWADAVQARHIDAELAGIRPPLMMGIDAAARAEVMLGRPGVELIESQRLGAGGNLQIAEFGGHRDSPAHPAKGTVAAPRGAKPIHQAD